MVTKDETQQVAFKLVAAAGEAFSHFYQAVERARAGDFDAADAEMAAGEQYVNEAHGSQFALLSDTANGKDVPLDVLLVHGQDHLMTTIMYSRVAGQLVQLYRDLDARGISFAEVAR